LVIVNAALDASVIFTHTGIAVGSDTSRRPAAPTFTVPVASIVNSLPR
jgi:hypothetical protein